MCLNRLGRFHTHRLLYLSMLQYIRYKILVRIIKHKKKDNTHVGPKGCRCFTSGLGHHPYYLISRLRIRKSERFLRLLLRPGNKYRKVIKRMTLPGLELIIAKSHGEVEPCWALQSLFGR